MASEDLEKAISATANRKYEDFADAIKGDVEGKFKDEIEKVVNRTKATMFGGEEPTPEEVEEPEVVDPPEGDDPPVVDDNNNGDEDE